MEEIYGYTGERHGVRVTVLKKVYGEESYFDMMQTAVELIQEGM